MVATFGCRGWVSELGACRLHFVSFSRDIMEKWDWAFDGVCMMDQDLLLRAFTSFLDLLHDVMTDMMKFFTFCMRFFSSGNDSLNSFSGTQDVSVPLVC